MCVEFSGLFCARIFLLHDGKFASFIFPGPELHEVRTHPMQPLAVLCRNRLPTPRFASAFSPGMVLPRHVFVHPFHSAVLVLLFGTFGFTVDRVADTLIGLSCIAIAATLASFLTTYKEGLPFRWPLIAVSICATVAGLACLLSAAVIHDLHPHVVANAPLVVAILAVLCACVAVRAALPDLQVARARIANLAAHKTEARFSPPLRARTLRSFCLKRCVPPTVPSKTFSSPISTPMLRILLPNAAARSSGRGSHAFCRSTRTATSSAVSPGGLTASR